LLGVSEFALGSTMVFRATDAGHLSHIEDYLADDYQLGLHISRQGRHVVFAPFVVETSLGAASWRDVWRHQLRWSRTIRVSRPSGYYGYIVTHATVWAIVALAAGAWPIAIATFGLRVTAAVLAGAVVLRDRAVLHLLPFIPLRDLFGFAVWIAGLCGNTVHWRGQRLRLRRDGRLT